MSNKIDIVHNVTAGIFDPWTKEILKSDKLRHEMGQGEETDQTRLMRNIEAEYNELKETCETKGKHNMNYNVNNLCVIFLLMHY